eukprot:5642785-Alexandrium_andersonii.AAC.1
MAVAGKDRFKAKEFMARCLAWASADLNIRTGTGASPLHLAASGGSFEVVDALLHLRADPQVLLTPLPTHPSMLSCRSLPRLPLLM